MLCLDASLYQFGLTRIHVNSFWVNLQVYLICFCESTDVKRDSPTDFSYLLDYGTIIYLNLKWWLSLGTPSEHRDWLFSLVGGLSTKVFVYWEQHSGRPSLILIEFMITSSLVLCNIYTVICIPSSSPSYCKVLRSQLRSTLVYEAETTEGVSVM